MNQIAFLIVGKESFHNVSWLEKIEDLKNRLLSIIILRQPAIDEKKMAAVGKVF